VIREGSIIMIDDGCTVEGYQSDITRTFVLGKASAKMKEVFDIVHRAQAAALAAARPGVECGSVDAAARKVITGAGYGPDYKYFTHRLGHGMGMDGHEWPYLVRGNTTKLALNMTTSDEPGIYIRGEFGIRLEDDMHITERRRRALHAAEPVVGGSIREGLRAFSELSPNPLLRGFDLQVVGHREYPRDTVGAKASHVLVRLVIDDAFECDVAVLNDDSNWLLYAHGILLQHRVSVDGAKQAPAQAIIHARGRKNLDLVIDLLDSFDMLHRVSRIGFERGLHDLAQQRNVKAFHLKRYRIEHTEIGEHDKLVPNFLNDTFLCFGRGLVTILGKT
jgi:hypothetical protein